MRILDPVFMRHVRGRASPVLVFSAVSLALGACFEPHSVPKPPPDSLPQGVRAGAFFWREVRGDRDRLAEYRVLRDLAVGVLAETAGSPTGAPFPAAFAVAEARETFDESFAPEELAARLFYFDRLSPPAAEGVELVLERRRAVSRGVNASGEIYSGKCVPRLVLTLEDLCADGAVDGTFDRLRLEWSGSSPPEWPEKPSIVIEIAREGPYLVENVDIAGERRYRLVAPGLQTLFTRLQASLYGPLGAAAFRRAVREGPVALRPRPAEPANTSFPRCGPETP